jgi:N-acetylmuramoyl-L-alanine amidase
MRKISFALLLWAILAATTSASFMSLPTCSQQPPAAPKTSAVAKNSGDEELLPGGIRIRNKLINFDQERIDLTLAYRRAHQDPQAHDITIHPQVIILHWTAMHSFESAWNYFNRTRAEGARTELSAAGEVNVSAHFLVDRDGTIYRLVPETWMARHCIGLNHLAIGIENVGNGEKFPLTDAQVKADAALVRYLAGKFPITHLIGHQEYRRMEGTAFFVERDPKYRNTKPDPGADFLRKVRALVADLKLEGPP